jgi:hypothetical protein
MSEMIDAADTNLENSPGKTQASEACQSENVPALY